MDRENTLKKYVGDMVAVEREILSAIEPQLSDEHVKGFADVEAALSKAVDMLRRHVSALEQLDGHGDSASAKTKEAVAGVVGFMASLYGKIRTQEVSKMLRDDFVALNVAAISYAMLHTTALALKDGKIAELTLQHHGEFPAILRELNSLIPRIVARELADGDKTVDISAGDVAWSNLQRDLLEK